jgi:DNA-binding response OmpR family regulator
VTRILLIDDEPFFARMTAAMLAPADVSVARNGAEGLRMIQGQSFDLVVTDLLMPEKDGIETILELRKRDATLPVLAISGGGSIGHRGDLLRMAQELGATATLSKPFTREELIAAVSLCLESAKRQPAD